MGIGRYVLGLAALATGVIDLIWGVFEPAHQPIQAYGNKLTGRGGFADAVGVVLVVGAIAIMTRRGVRIGALLVAIGYLVFAIFWAPRIYWASTIIGWTGAIGAVGGVGQQAILIAAAAIIYALATAPSGAPWAPAVLQIARWVFGISTIFFGLAHFTGIASTALMVPKWIPPGADFWVVVTGLAFVAAGIGIVSGIRDVLAARLLTLMLLIFGAIVLLPIIPPYVHSEIAWGSNAYNLAAAGAAWVLSDWLASLRRNQGWRRDAFQPSVERV